MREQNLRVAGYPRIEPQRGRPAATEALEFSAVFEVYPEIKVGDLAASRSSGRSRRGRRRRISIDTLEVLRKQRTTIRPVERAARRRAIGCTVDFTGTIDGVEFPGGQAQDFRSCSAKAACCPSSRPRSRG